NLGGQVLMEGRQEWIEVAHPSKRSLAVARWKLDSGSLATSGNSERSRTVHGVQIGHVLDGRTGRPAKDFGSVTVWCSSALDADCLSTALFAMGPEEGLRFASNRTDVRVLFIEEREGDLRLSATRNCEPYLTSTKNIFWFPEDNPKHLSKKEEKQ
ncbi:MAG: FAD:protein FMN transferase, partial [Planctomycetes bacterium]|nr:FAD:protein FMN transferase [Planctomycetota bacterium]